MIDNGLNKNNNKKITELEEVVLQRKIVGEVMERRDL